MAGALLQGGQCVVPGLPVHPGPVHLHPAAALAQLGLSLKHGPYEGYNQRTLRGCLSGTLRDCRGVLWKNKEKEGK